MPKTFSLACADFMVRLIGWATLATDPPTETRSMAAPGVVAWAAGAKARAEAATMAPVARRRLRSRMMIRLDRRFCPNTALDATRWRQRRARDPVRTPPRGAAGAVEAPVDVVGSDPELHRSVGAGHAAVAGVRDLGGVLAALDLLDGHDGPTSGVQPGSDLPAREGDRDPALG